MLTALCVDAVEIVANRRFLHSLRDLPPRERADDSVRGRSIQLAAVVLTSLPHHYRLEAFARPGTSGIADSPPEPSPHWAAVRSRERPQRSEQQPCEPNERHNSSPHASQSLLYLG